MHHCATLDIDLSAIQANYRLLRARLDGRRCGAVVKANAYGLGMARVAPALAAAGCESFFVATLEESLALREVLPGAAIYVFNGAQKGEGSEFTAARLIPVLNSMEQLGHWAGGDAALHIDTGMTRLGLSDSEAEALAEDKARVETLGIRMVMSHLACANEPDAPHNAEQLARFERGLRRFDNLAASLANSSGIFLSPQYHYDLARPGCALYGINPTSGVNPMRQVARLTAPILQIRTLERDENIGYGATYHAPKGSRIAIVALGYADGWPRLLSNGGFAFIAGQKLPIAGRISMDMLAIDITLLPETSLTPDTRAEFIGAQQTVDEVAAAAGTIGYEIFTRIGARVRRIHV